MSYEIDLALVACLGTATAALTATDVPAAAVFALSLALLVVIPLRTVYPVGAVVAGSLLGIPMGGASSIELLLLPAIIARLVAQRRELDSAMHERNVQL